MTPRLHWRHAQSRRLLSSLLGLWLLALGSGPLAESALLSGVEHADTAVPVAVLLGQAEAGDARASFLLGTRYASGRAGYRDDSEAVRWFRRAAEGGLAEAQYNLGVMYASGRGVPRDAAAASQWYEQAALQGVPEAQYNLGTAYATGQGVEKNLPLAVKWLGRAAEAGLAQAQFNLGALYEHGHGVPRNEETAAAWYREAATRGYAPAESRLAHLRSGREPSADERVAEPPAPATPVPDAGEPSGSAGEPRGPANAWLLTQSAGHYTLQLISHASEASARAFIDTRRLGGQARYYTAEVDGKRYYSVIYGVYPSHDQALAATAELPEGLADLEPWVRNLGQLQGLVSRSPD